MKVHTQHSSLTLFAITANLLLLFLLGASPARAEPVTLKFATLAPEGTTWYRSIRNIADEWERISAGEVKVKIYAGGVAGNESAMVRKMRIGQLHGALMTNIGVADIDQAPQVTQAPMLIRNYDELDYVMKHMAPTFEKRLEDRGVIVLNWGEVGWVHLFTGAPLTRVADAKKFKAYAYESDPQNVKLFEGFGFHPVVMASTDVLPGLQSGLIDAFPATPLGALSMQWFALAKNMLDVPWAPLVGATVISQKGWDAIPAKYHDEFRAVARKEGLAVQATVREQDGKAIKVMQKYGLKVNRATPASRAEWERSASSTWGVMSNIVGDEVFQRAQALVQEHRSERASQ
jgi:TRAP-type C4-dicarboxylate transport system substrate-binding protein